jgi:hypothetical protein
MSNNSNSNNSLFEGMKKMYLYLDYLKQKRNFNKLNNSTYYLTSEEKAFLKTLMG